MVLGEREIEDISLNDTDYETLESTAPPPPPPPSVAKGRSALHPYSSPTPLPLSPLTPSLPNTHTHSPSVNAEPAVDAEAVGAYSV